jgi:hypothetical protein
MKAGRLALLGVVLAAVAVTAMEWPDLVRYFKIRSM